MNSIRSFFASMTLSGVVLAAATGALAQQSDDLQKYLAEPSPKYSIINTKKTDAGDGLWRYEVDFHSVQWRDAKEVSTPVWQHKLVIFTPKQWAARTVVMGVGGGVQGMETDTSRAEERLARDIALKSGFASAVVKTIPNQPLQFMGDGKNRYEDDIIAYSWDKYLRTLDAKWLPLFPMVKSAHLAMDTITKTLTIDRPKLGEPEFVVYGASKRGWTTWLTAATDKRVVGIAPIVIDMLNMKPSLINHRESLGEWSVALKDYVHHKITERIETPEMAESLKRIDPLSYVELLKLPKFLLNMANDQFFTPDSSTFYYDKLQGPKWLRYFPNAGHNRKGVDLATPISIFAQHVSRPKALAPLHWTLAEDGRMTYSSEQAPSKLILWEAVNPTAKDFRLMSADFPRYVPTELITGKKEYSVRKPSKGYKSFFYEFTFTLPNGQAFTQTTSARIISAP